MFADPCDTNAPVDSNFNLPSQHELGNSMHTETTLRKSWEAALALPCVAPAYHLLPLTSKICSTNMLVKGYTENQLYYKGSHQVQILRDKEKQSFSLLLSLLAW